MPIYQITYNILLLDQQFLTNGKFLPFKCRHIAWPFLWRSVFSDLQICTSVLLNDLFFGDQREEPQRNVFLG